MDDKNKDSETILSQWKTCVEMADSVSHRRDVMNNIFVTANLALVAAVSATWGLKSICILIAGIFLCFIWLGLICNYKQLNKAKFDVIGKLENQLPMKPLTDEWKLLRADNRYSDGTALEKSLPQLFLILYSISLLIIIFTKYYKGA